MSDVTVILRWSDGAIGLTGWGWFILICLTWVISAAGRR